jgi:hypothetical protein
MEQTNWRCVRQEVGKVLIHAGPGDVESVASAGRLVVHLTRLMEFTLFS